MIPVPYPTTPQKISVRYSAVFEQFEFFCNRHRNPHKTSVRIHAHTQPPHSPPIFVCASCVGTPHGKNGCARRCGCEQSKSGPRAHECGQRGGGGWLLHAISTGAAGLDGGPQFFVVLVGTQHGKSGCVRRCGCNQWKGVTVVHECGQGGVVGWYKHE